MISLYLFCTVSGAGFVVLTNLLGHAAGGGDGHGGGGHGHGHGHSSDDGHDGLAYFSPTAIAAYVTGFGAAGLALTRGLGVENPLLHIPVAAVFAALFGVGLLSGMARLTRHAEGNSLSNLDELVGQEVEVSISVPAGGSGEVAFVSAGTRQTAIAQSEAGQVFAQGSRVRVTRVVDGMVRVTIAPTLGAGAVVSVGEPVGAPPQKNRVH